MVTLMLEGPCRSVGRLAARVFALRRLGPFVGRLPARRRRAGSVGAPRSVAVRFLSLGRCRSAVGLACGSSRRGRSLSPPGGAVSVRFRWPASTCRPCPVRFGSRRPHPLSRSSTSSVPPQAPSSSMSWASCSLVRFTICGAASLYRLAPRMVS